MLIIINSSKGSICVCKKILDKKRNGLAISLIVFDSLNHSKTRAERIVFYSNNVLTCW